MKTLSIHKTQSIPSLTAEHVQRFAFAYCWKRTGNEDDAKEFSQYFVLHYLQRKPKETNLDTPWHILNIRHLFLNFLNRHKDKRQIPVPEPVTETQKMSTQLNPLQATQNTDPLQSAQLEELLEIIESIRCKFCQRDQQIIRLKILGHQAMEITRLLLDQFGIIKTSNVDVIYYRFKITLKQTLISKGFNLSKGD